MNSFTMTLNPVIYVLVKGSHKKNMQGIKSGDYLKTDYLDAIEKTHSPYAARALSEEPTLLTAY